MNRIEALELFINKHVKKLSLEKILKLEEYYQNNKEDLKKDFLKSFIGICKKAQNKEEIGYITYSMLRTNLMENNKNYLIEVSDETWFLDENKCTGEYNGGFAFNILTELEEELKELVKPYLEIKAFDVEALIRKEASKYNEYIISIARYALKDIETLEEFQSLNLSEEFEVRIGEFRDITEAVFKKDTREKDSLLIKELFEERDPDDNYSYEVYRNLNLKNGDYNDLDFRYSDFRESDLSKSIMRNCVLTGVDFRKCTLMKADFRDSYIYEADFENANLKGSNFSRATGYKGLLKGLLKEKWTMPGFEKVNFKNSNLENVKFKNADLIGADFQGANLKGTSFIGADLTEAIFLKEDKPKIHLSENQEKNIIWK